ncbi:MAG: hypothetical protein JWP18_2408, partial [Solirubrobacterales bacterium]|nr:hypothetical protein [Solirubrobacterales bacterium]
MPRHLLATTLVAVVAALCCTPSPATAAGAVPAPLPLTAGWERLADPGAVGVAQGLWRADSQAAWQPAVVPSVLQTATTRATFGGTVGWYRVRVRVPPKTPGFGWAVRFGQVRRSAQVWLNGVPLGASDDPYVPFELNAGDALKPGAENVLVVRADNRRVPGTREGWWNWGGIPRPVTLVPRGALALRAPAVLSDVRCRAGGEPCTRRVIFDAVLENRSTRTVPGARVDVRVAGAAATIRARTLAPGEQTHLRRAIAVPGAKLWSPEDPQLYDVTVTTTAGTAVQQVDRWRTGLREVQVRGGMLTLNGRQLNLHGASIQEDVPGRGPALTDADIRKIVADLKAVHANVTRAHYLLNEELLNALDAAGIMVWSQAPIYHRDVQLRSPADRERSLETVRATILGARNHPSVITHSVANELSATPDTVPPTSAFLDAARRVARDADPTLPVSVDLLSYPGYARQRAYAQYDLLGINSYFGWYRGKADHSVERLSDLGPFLDHMRLSYPSQGLVVTEFGAESTFTGPAKEKETYAFQTEYLRDVLDIVARRPFVSGSIYWTLQEFAVKPEWDGGAERNVRRDSIHNKGLITYTGRRKPAWDVAEQRFADASGYREVSAAAASGRLA